MKRETKIDICMIVYIVEVFEERSKLRVTIFLQACSSYARGPRHVGGVGRKLIRLMEIGFGVWIEYGYRWPLSFSRN